MTLHPKPNDKGQAVTISKPHSATAHDTWADPSVISIATPMVEMPPVVGGIPITNWQPPGADNARWLAMAEAHAIEEPPFESPNGLNASAGVVTIEPDGRVWVVAPSNGFGGYLATFPKGRLETGMSLQATAIREGFEESGLQVRLHSFLVDVSRSTTYTRYYVAHRVSGNPAEMGWESQAVMLVPMARLAEELTNKNDQPIINALQTAAA